MTPELQRRLRQLREPKSQEMTYPCGHRLIFFNESAPAACPLHIPIIPVIVHEPVPPAPLSGTVNTDGSDSVVWASGDKFLPGVVGKTITIASVDHTILTYVSDTEITVDPLVPAAMGAAYVILL